MVANGILRGILAGLAGALVSMGYMDEHTAQVFTGAILNIFVIAWSIYEKSK